MQDRHATVKPRNVLKKLLLFVLACGIAAALHYGFWLGAIAGVVLNHVWLKALAVGMLLLNGYFIYYRLWGGSHD